MDRTSIRREVLIAVITAAITTVVFTQITLSLAYKLNDYWSKDNISIERVDLIPDTTKLLYPSKEIMMLVKILGLRTISPSDGRQSINFILDFTIGH